MTKRDIPPQTGPAAAKAQADWQPDDWQPDDWQPDDWLADDWLAEDGLADDPVLAQAFAAARGAAVPVPSAALMARVLEDARRLQPAPMPDPLPHPAPRARPLPGRAKPVGLWPRLRALWPEVAPLGGLGLAALAGGLWIGLTAPDLAAPLLPAGVVAAELFPGDGDVVASFTLLSES